MAGVTSKLHKLKEDVRSFYAVAGVKRMHQPSAAEFLREAVSCHQPVIITGLLDEWEAMEKWADTESFLSRAPKEVCVNFTPDGRADAVTHDGYFAKPCEVKMNTRQFMEMLEDPTEEDAVPYLSRQSDNVRELMPTLLEDCSPSINLGDESFGTEVEAVNLWVGDARSVSSLHKDFFENFYAVVRGTKTFTLYPPTDVMWLKSKSYPSAVWERKNGRDDGNSIRSRPQKTDLTLAPEGGGAGVKWIPIDPLDPSSVARHPDIHIENASPVNISVSAGETLYLPALWLHRVTSTTEDLTVSVNYWYDMRFDLRYCFYRFASLLLDDDDDNDDDDGDGNDDNDDDND